MRFSYYNRLSLSQRRIYDQSDRVSVLELRQPERHHGRVLALGRALESGKRTTTRKCAQELLDGLTEAFGVSSLKVSVRERRPSSQTSELHGLYEADGGGPPRVSVWMRTAQRAQVVKFKTFLRTLIHELCHHLDYQRFRFKDSYHTEGFYKRESSLMRQLYREPQTGKSPANELRSSADRV